MKKSNTRLEVKGLNQERVINKIVKNTKIYNYKRISHNLSQFEVGFLNSKKIINLLKAEGYEVEILGHGGALYFIKKLFSRYGLISALILCAIAYCVQYNFVLRVDVCGAAAEDSSKIAGFVEKNIGNRYKKNINTKNIELLVKENFPSVSSVSVAIIGQSLIVNINPSIMPDEMKEGQALLSQFDGLITDIELIQGTLAVKVGDIVKKGDVLVYPYITDSQGQKRDVWPKANIYADVWLKGEENHYDYRIERVRTGRKMTQSYLYLSNLLLYSSNRVLLFEDYECEEKIIEVTKNNLLPLFRKTVTYYEIMTKEVVQEFSDVKEQKIKTAKEKALIFLQENEIIKEENYTIRENCGCYQVEYVITVNRKIGG